MRKSTSKWRKKWLPTLLVPVIAFGGFMGNQVLRAEEEIPVLTKEAFIDQVLTNNTTIMSLERQLDDLQEQANSVGQSTKGLVTLQKNVSEYNRVYELYEDESTQPTHMTYLNLSYKAYLSSIMMGPALTVDETNELVAATATLTGNGEISNMMSIQDYIIYQQLSAVFGPMGFSGKPIEKWQEYETFVYPSRIVPLQMGEGVQALKEGIRSAEDGLERGAAKLFDTLVMMQDLSLMLEKNYALASLKQEDLTAKYERGQVSEYQFTESKNSEEIARINYENLLRNIDNIKMNINIMRGVDPTIDFQIESNAVLVVKLDDLDVYVGEALEKNNDLLASKKSLDTQSAILATIGEYYNKDSRVYQNELNNYNIKRIDYEALKKSLEIDILGLYYDVEESRNAYITAKKDLDQMKETLDEVTLNYELGFVTLSTVDEVNIGVIQMANSMETAASDYYEKMEDLYETAGLPSPY